MGLVLEGKKKLEIIKKFGLTCSLKESMSVIVEKATKKVIVEKIEPENEVTTESALIDDLGAESLDQVEIIMELEEKFDVEISSGDYMKFKTIGEIVNDVMEQLNKQLARA